MKPTLLKIYSYYHNTGHNLINIKQLHAGILPQSQGTSHSKLPPHSLPAIRPRRPNPQTDTTHRRQIRRPEFDHDCQSTIDFQAKIISSIGQSPQDVRVVVSEPNE